MRQCIFYNFSFHSTLFFKWSHVYSLHELNKMYLHVLILMDIWIVCCSEGHLYKPFHVHWQFLFLRMWTFWILLWMPKFPKVFVPIHITIAMDELLILSTSSPTLGISWFFFISLLGFNGIWVIYEIYSHNLFK